MKKITKLRYTTSQISPLFFPRIIREFDDGPDEKPMLYGDD